MTVTEALNRYEAMSGANAYRLFFVQKHTLYTMTAESLRAEWATLEAESQKNGGGLSLRLRFRKAVKEELIASGLAEAIGAEDLLTSDRLNAGLKKINKGIAAERLAKEMAGLGWGRHDNRKFTEGGDLRVGGVEIQVKLDGATIASCRTLATL